MNLQILLFALCVGAVTAIPIPMKLLKVPKIYNALITTNQKLLPSEAFPASTGQVFEPIGLSGDPVLLNPEAFVRDEPTVEGEAPRPFSKDGKRPTPVVFYPRYNVYHQLPQSVFPFTDVYQPPPIVVPVQRSEPPKLSTFDEAPSAAEEAPPVPAALAPSRPQGFGFVANNRPAGDIPHVPPPPPPVGASRPPTTGEDDGSQ